MNISIWLIAGNEERGYSEGLRSYAKFNSPSALAFDHESGIIYVVDKFNDLIRKIEKNGQVSTIAGSTQGFVNGTGTEARFNFPEGICIDKYKNLYITDGRNNVIRKITSNGEVTTIAGNVLCKAGFRDGCGSAASFSRPSGICIDADDNLFVCDVDNNSIRKINYNGFVTTIAGDMESGFCDGIGYHARFSSPTSIHFDSNGNLFILDVGNSAIRKLSVSGLVSTLYITLSNDISKKITF